MKKLQLTYGLDESGELLHIERVAQGLACNCVCPHCKAKLIARKGTKRQPHFAHHKSEDCLGARMTTLHMLAQKIIEHEKKVCLPEYKGVYYKEKSKVVQFNHVRIEQQVIHDNINRRPDCVGIINNKELWIEIMVTHAIDEEKEKDIKKANVACIEIDLSEILREEYTEQFIKQRLMSCSENKKWINNPKLEEKDRQEKLKYERKKAEQAKVEEHKRSLFFENIDSWMKTGSDDSAEFLIEHIRKAPYDNNIRLWVLSYLIRNDILTWITESPTNKNIMFK